MESGQSLAAEPSPVAAVARARGASAMFTEHDVDETIAGAKIGLTVIDLARQRNRMGKFTEEDNVQLEHCLQDLLTPSSCKDVSAEKLKMLLIGDYLEQASKLMIEVFKDRKAIFPVKKRDSDLLPGLQEQWTKRGIKSEISSTIVYKREEHVAITLSW